MAAYLPPLQETYYDLNSLSRQSFYEDNNVYDKELSNVKYSEILKLPYNLKGFFDYQEALNYSKKNNKPMLLDFTGHGVLIVGILNSGLANDRVGILNNKYVLVSLYVDDKTKLSEKNWYVSKYDSKIKNIRQTKC